jgi:hypothetical protein
MGGVVGIGRFRAGVLALLLGATTTPVSAQSRPAAAGAAGSWVIALDHAGQRVDPLVSHASLSRVLPAELSPDRDAPDRDALTWMAVARPGRLPLAMTLVSTRPNGAKLDQLVDVPLRPAKCPATVPPGLRCAKSAAIRACPDEIDAGHPAARERSLQARVGGKLVAYVDDEQVATLPVGGPRSSALGPLERFRATVRVHIVRLSPGGSVPVGADPVGAVERARQQLDLASAIWGQCGIVFHAERPTDISVVEPPPPHLLAVGCGLGLPASGGEIRFRVGRRRLLLRTVAGQTPTQVARELAARLASTRLRATVSVNARTGFGALRTADVLVREPSGALARIERDDDQPVSTDPSLRVCIGEVDLSDGLTHFGDDDSAAGTVEERTLLKAFEDGDPTTIEIYIIAAFAESGRIGESFVLGQDASVMNTVIISRAGIRIAERSFALAHELGHILLELPGHPDDYGVDQPWRLMDADAADASVFGPRRLSIAECERAVRQSGAQAPVPLLRPWPLVRGR